MPTIQTNYLDQLPLAFEGMIADTEPSVLISRDVEAAVIGFGKAVKQGTLDYQVQGATAAADVYRGITVRDNFAGGTGVDVDKYPIKSSAMLMVKGVIWVTAGATVVAGAPVYMVVGTGNAGKFTSVSTSNLPIPNAIFETGGALDGLVAIRLN